MKRNYSYIYDFCLGLCEDEKLRERDRIHLAKRKILESFVPNERNVQQL